MRCRIALWGFLLVLPSAAALADPPPWLNAMQVVQASTQVAHQVPGSKGDFVIAPQPYDTQIKQWVTLVKPDTGPGFLITIDEATGLVCARFENADGCAATGSVTTLVEQAKAVARAREEALRTPPPDPDGLVITLLQSLAEKEPATPQPRSHWYITVMQPNGTPGDPSTRALASIHIPGADLFPGSKAPAAPPSDTTVSRDVRYSVDLPLRRPDGNYDVNLGYYCGSLCAGSSTYVMAHDAHGWRIVSHTMNWIS